MAPTHPRGILVNIVGISCADNGRSCEEHAVCGSVVDIDVVVRIRKEQVVVNGREETALCVYWVTDGVDRCRVGFLQRHLVKHHSNYDGKLAQVVEFLSTSDSPADKAKAHRNKGICRASIIDAEDNSPKKERPCK